jgi:hypothetical protein
MSIWLDLIRVIRNNTAGQAWWYIPVILALGRLRQKDHKFKTGLGHRVRPCLKKQKQKTRNNTVLAHSIYGFWWIYKPPPPFSLGVFLGVEART